MFMHPIFPLITSSHFCSMMSTNASEKEKASSCKDETLPYVCVHCGAPCTSLYRRLSVSLSSIKAINCKRCGHVSDPYIEREWLLVTIDCILLRQEAFRHVLFNVDELKNISWRKSIQLLSAWAILDGYLKWVSLMNDQSTSSRSEEISQDRIFVFWLGASSFCGMIIQCFLLNFCTKIMTQKTPSLSVEKIFWAFLLPSSFSVVTIIVTIWENTKVVQLLGALMISSWRAMAFYVISESVQLPIVGFVAGISWQLLVSMFSIQPSPCNGLELDTFGKPWSLCLF